MATDAAPGLVPPQPSLVKTAEAVRKGFQVLRGHISDTHDFKEVVGKAIEQVVAIALWAESKRELFRWCAGQEGC